MPDRPDPYRSFHYRIQLNGVTCMYCTEVTGFDMNADAGEVRDEFSPTVRRLPGRYKHGNVTLKRGMVEDTEMLNWIKSVREGKIERKSLTITAMDEEGRDSAAWQVNNAWPIKYSMSEFKGSGNEVLVEVLELAHEGMIRSR